LPHLVGFYALGTHFTDVYPPLDTFQAMHFCGAIARTSSSWQEEWGIRLYKLGRHFGSGTSWSHCLCTHCTYQGFMYNTL